MIRINKYLSMCGVTSRRGAEALIAEGLVVVNGHTVEKVGTVIDESADVVKVDGVEVKPVDELVYVVLNKPPMVMTTLSDPFKRKTVVNFLKKLRQRVYPVGRLDYDTEGVLLLTNDGELAYRLAHPSFEIAKVYEAMVEGSFTRIAADMIQKGIRLEDGSLGRARVDILGYVKNTTRLRLTLHEGRKREVKQLCKAVGHKVIRLRRVEFAGITARGLKTGEWRLLSATEISRLHTITKTK
ncbi:MAG: rRNA pseudouridine synthase [candidate division Zixibacteria bacterium]|nr:rRNA pseudouridine synthase [candidate division Zixibacteria bacterium]